MNFISIDFETANERRNSPCAIGVVVANEHGIMNEFYSLINPLMPFKSMNTYIHGITEADVQDAPTFGELWPTLLAYLADQVVVAHNASFDMSVLRKTLDHFQLPYPDMAYLCTVNISKQVWPDLPNHKLDTLAASQGITFEHHHALEDARVAAKVLIKAMAAYQSQHLDQFLQKCKVTKGKIYQHGYFPPKVRRARRSSKIYI